MVHVILHEFCVFLVEGSVAWFLPQHGKSVRAKLIVAHLCESSLLNVGKASPKLHDLDCFVEFDDRAEELARVVKDQMVLEAGNDVLLRVE